MVTFFPAQPSYGASSVPTAAKLNTHSTGVDWLNFKRPVLSCWQGSTTTSFGSGALTSMVFDVVGADTYNVSGVSGYGTSSGIYTVPVTGVYLVNCCVNFAFNASGFRSLWVNIKSSAGVVWSPPGGVGWTASQTYNTCLTYTTIMHATAGDQMWVQAYQDSGSTISSAVNANTSTNVNETSYFQVMWVSA